MLASVSFFWTAWAEVCTEKTIKNSTKAIAGDRFIFWDLVLLSYVKDVPI
jgi:hypothetical protein